MEKEKRRNKLFPILIVLLVAATAIAAVLCLFPMLFGGEEAPGVGIENTTEPTTRTDLPSESTQPSGESQPVTDPVTEPVTEPATEPENTQPSEPVIGPTVHQHEYAETLTPPTCVSQGFTTYACACGDSYTGSYTDPIPHEYVSQVIAATCTEDGYTLYTCACGDSYTGEVVPGTGHHYTEAVTAPTCTAEGYTTYTCTCGDSYTGNRADALGHRWSEWKTVVAPTETAYGKAERACSGCKATESRQLDKVIPNHTHSYTGKVTKQPTCTAEGVKTYTCSCGGSYTEAVAKLPHSYTDKVTKPTCTAGGCTTHTCKVCAYSYTDSKTPAAGHSYANTVTKPTCTKEGCTTHTCKVCAYSYTDSKTPAAGHSYTNTVTKPTCTKEGYTTHTCKVCAYSYTDSKTSATGHRYRLTATIAATCTADGSKTYTCAYCPDQYKETVVGEHKYLDTVTKPTCTKEGYTTHTCKVCSHSYTDSKVAASGHNWGSQKAVWPTCTEAGYYYWDCKTCGERKTEAGNAAYGHVHVITGEKDGKFIYSCKYCSDSYAEDLDTRYDASLAVPKVLSEFPTSMTLSINCEATFENDSGYGIQCILARDEAFTSGILSEKTNRQWNNLGYAKIGFYYVRGSFYYKVRTYKMEGDTFVYGPWSKTDSIACLNYNTKLSEAPKYSYEVYFVDDNGTDAYTGCNRAVYIKTDNPSGATISLVANGQDIIGKISIFGKAQYYDDVEYLDITDSSESLHKVPGGYLGILDAETAGKLDVEIWEISSKGYIVADTFKLNVLDYETVRNQWIDNAIASQTNDSMTPKEKMDAIADFLSNGQFKYVTNSGGTRVSLAALPNTPWFLSKRWDSATSPAMLAVFAERIGGFEEIHNCYADYPRGTSEWAIYHHQTYVVYQGQKYYYTVCPLTPTGDVGTVEMVDFTKLSRLTKIS